MKERARALVVTLPVERPPKQVRTLLRVLESRDHLQTSPRLSIQARSFNPSEGPQETITRSLSLEYIKPKKTATSKKHTKQ